MFAPTVKTKAQTVKDAYKKYQAYCTLYDVDQANMRIRGTFTAGRGSLVFFDYHPTEARFNERATVFVAEVDGRLMKIKPHDDREFTIEFWR